MSNSKRIYLDYAATTPLDTQVELAMRPHWFALGNPSSVHHEGAKSRQALESARAQFATAIGAHAREIIFTSGGTEANNQAIFAFGLARGGHIISTQIEHSATLAPLRALAAMGKCEITLLAPNENGIVSADDVAAAIQTNTSLVSVQHVNNEVGTIQDIQSISEICRERGIVLHTDAVQSLGVIELNAHELGADLISFSAHKFYGPKGIGALYVRQGLEIPALMLGGQQERGLRGGTHNLPGAVGMALAAEIAKEIQATEFIRLRELQNFLETECCKLDGVKINASAAPRSPKVLSVTASGADGEAMLMNMDLEGFSVSMGSACSAGTLEPSHVLLAMGLSQEDARSSLRFSFGRQTNKPELELAIAAFKKILARVRA